MPKPGTVWLVGMMGAGKSTLGPRLARRLDLAFVDTDADVEREAGCSIARLFEREGESAFRARERRAIDAIAGQPAVVALGGGAVVQPGVLARLRSSGVVVYLRASPRALLARLGDAAERPLLAGLAPSAREARLAELLEARRPFYERADVVLETDDVEPEALVEALAARLRERRAC